MNDQSLSERRIAGVPVKNIWFLMFYASELLKHVGKDRVELDEAPDDYFDLIGKILLMKVEKRLRVGLKRQYIERKDVLTRVKGRIKFIESERKQLIIRGKILCQYNLFSNNIPRNCYIRGALEKLSQVTLDTTIGFRAKSCARQMRELGVVDPPPKKSKLKQERLGRSDRDDKAMLDAAHLIYDIALLNEEAGSESLLKPDQSEEFVKQLFIEALKGFYTYSLQHSGWEVDSLASFDWGAMPKNQQAFIPLENIACDIALHHHARGESYLIDAEFSSLFKETGMINEGELFPLFTLLTTQRNTPSINKKAKGLLFRPVVDDVVDESVMIKGSEIKLCTLDLRQEPKQIRRQLLNQITFQ